MDNETPAHAGWRLARKNPKLVLLEVAWRWSFGLLALLLLWWAIVSVLHRVTISDADWAALRSLNLHDTPQTLAKIVVLFWEDFLLMLAALLSALALAWMITATWGRAATLYILTKRNNTRAVAGLTLLRILLFLATLLATVFAVEGAAWVSTPAADAAEPNWMLYLLMVLIALPLIMTAWGILNWVLSLAPLFAVREQKGAFTSLAAAFRSLRCNRKVYWSVSGVYGLYRGAALVTLTVTGLVLLALSQSKIVLGLLLALLLLYFAFADLLYVARLAAYLQIVEEQLPASSCQPPVKD